MPGLAKHVRPEAAAGRFYSAEPAALRREVADLLGAVDPNGPTPKALIVPHAAYRYSGSVAASGFVLLTPVRRSIERVVLLGPSHHVPFFGLAMSDDDAFATPLGTIPLDMHSMEMSLPMATGPPAGRSSSKRT